MIDSLLIKHKAFSHKYLRMPKLILRKFLFMDFHISDQCRCSGVTGP